MKEQYYVTFVILSDFTTKVTAESPEEAKELAKKAYYQASLGDFEFADLMDVNIEKIN